VSVYDEDIETARELIEEFGQECFWQKPTPAGEGGTPGYPAEGGEPPDPIRCKIAFFPPRELGRGTMEFLEALRGTEVPAGREIGLMEGGVPFTPENVDMIRRGSATADPVAIERIDRLAPNGDPVLYYVTVSA
jgi:hypothetical protein